MINFNGAWKIVAYCNSDFAADKNIRNSVTGFYIYIRNNLILWKARSQKSVTLLLTESEYLSVSKVCAKLIFILHLLNFLGIGAVFLSYNAKNSNRTKHADIRANFVQQYVEDGIVKVIFSNPRTAKRIRLRRTLAEIFSNAMPQIICQTLMASRKDVGKDI